VISNNCELGFFLYHISVFLKFQHLLAYMILFHYHGYDVCFIVGDGCVSLHLIPQYGYLAFLACFY
jgi:hypothetical protein